jgi:hypothetical protein
VDPQDYELRVKQAAAALAQSCHAGPAADGTNDVVEIENTSVVNTKQFDEAGKS